MPSRPIKGRAVCGHARRRARSWPFDTLIGAICLVFRALSDAPISVANGHDLDPLRAWSQIALPLIGLLGTHRLFIDVLCIALDGLLVGGVLLLPLVRTRLDGARLLRGRHDGLPPPGQAGLGDRQALARRGS